MVRIWSHSGSIEVFGLQTSDVGMSSKSAVISHVSCELSVPSRRGVTKRLILHSDCTGSHVYSDSVISSFCRRYVGDCQVSKEVTLRGSIDVSMGVFFKVISRVVRILLVAFSRSWMVRIWSHIGTREVFGLQASNVGINSKSAVIKHVISDVSCQSKNGVTRRLILHSASSGSQLYSVKEVSSFHTRDVEDCQVNVDVTRVGSIEVSTRE